MGEVDFAVCEVGFGLHRSPCDEMREGGRRGRGGRSKGEDKRGVQSIGGGIMGIWGDIEHSETKRSQVRDMRNGVDYIRADMDGTKR